MRTVLPGGYWTAAHLKDSDGGAMHRCLIWPLRDFWMVPKHLQSHLQNIIQSQCLDIQSTEKEYYFFRMCSTSCSLATCGSYYIMTYKNGWATILPKGNKRRVVLDGQKRLPRRKKCGKDEEAFEEILRGQACYL